MNDADTPEAGSRTKYFLLWLVVIGLIVTALWFWLRKETTVETTLALPPPALVEPEPLIRHPIPDPAADDTEVEAETVSVLAGVLPASLPELDHSDQALLAIAERLIENPRLAELLIPRELIRRFVITVDGLGGRTVPPTHLPVSAPEGRFLVEQRGERSVINTRNYARYRNHVALLDQVDSEALARAYVHFYPLFQQAYRELGYPQGFFNDRLIAVIDEILATPEVEDPVRLEQPSVFYQHADPDLEALTAGQRLLIRMGQDNATSVKRKLREFKTILVR